MEFKGSQLITIVAMLCLTILEACALLSGTDGTYLLPIVSVIALLAGYQLPFALNKAVPVK